MVKTTVIQKLEKKAQKTPVKRTKRTEKPKAEIVAATKKTETVQEASPQTPYVWSAEEGRVKFEDIICSWFDGWRRSFDFKGRSPRFDLWAFLLVNTVLMTFLQIICSYVLSPAYLRFATEQGYSLSRIDNVITLAMNLFYLTIFVPLIPFGALITRRLHDLGRQAWHNFLEPIFMGVVVLWVLFITLMDLDFADYRYTSLLLSTCFMTILYSVGYYGLKVLIITMFYRGDLRDNEFGKSRGNDVVSERYALKFSCFYFLIMVTVALFYLMLALL